MLEEILGDIGVVSCILTVILWSLWFYKHPFKNKKEK